MTADYILNIIREENRCLAHDQAILLHIITCLGQFGSCYGHSNYMNRLGFSCFSIIIGRALVVL
jgi:hypothetical protein